MFIRDLEPHLQLRLLGVPYTVLDRRPVTSFRTSKDQALLFYLAAAGGAHRRSTLAALLWSEASEAHARASLRTSLSQLRKVVGEHLEITGATVALNRQGLWLDVAQFEALLRQTVQSKTDALEVHAAVSLYGGDFLDGFFAPDAPQFEQWLVTERERLRQAVVNALLALAEWHANQQDYAAGLDHLTRLLAIEPSSEAGHRQKMALLARMGQRSAALQQYNACRRILAEELGVEPSPETTALYERLLAGTLDAQRPTGPSGDGGPLPTPQPERLLSPAPPPLRPEQRRIDWRDMPHRSAFYGRQADIARLSRWLTTDGATLAAVSGLGGVGKTALAVEVVEGVGSRPFGAILWRSLLNAPPLAAVLDAWLQTMTGGSPDRLPDSLDEKLALFFTELQNQRCLLVLDNLESVMGDGTRAGYFRAGYEDYGHLIQRVARSRHQSCLLLTTRELPKGLRQLEEDSPRVRIMPLSGLPSAAAIELLRARGVAGSDPLLESLAARYSGNPLALKLVADSVRDFFGGQVTAFLDEETFVFDEIRDILDRQFDRLGDAEREIVTWLAVEREPVPAQTLWENLVHPPRRSEFLEVVRSLRRGSLVEEVAGPEDNAGLRLGLQNVVMEYTTDRLLDVFDAEIASGQLQWFQRHALLKAQSKEYVQESQRRMLLRPLAHRLVDRWGQPGAVRRLQDLLSRLRLEAPRAHGYAAANVLHLLLDLRVDLRGYDFSQLAIRQADLRTASLAKVDFSQADLTGSTFSDTFGVVKSVAWSPNGRYLAAAGSDGKVFVWQTAGYRPHVVLQGHEQMVGSIAFSPDSTVLASGGFDNLLCLWEVETGRLLHALRQHTDTIGAVAFSPDGAWLASGGADSQIVVWDWKHGGVRARLAEQAWIYGLAFSPDGRTLASALSDGKVDLWDWRDFQLQQTLLGHQAKLHAVAFDPVGNLLATGGEDNRIGLWRLGEDSPAQVLTGHTGWVFALAFSPDGQSLASASADGTVRIWNAADGRFRRSLPGHAAWATGVAFSPDGAVVASGGYDQSVRLWEVQTGLVLHTLRGYQQQADLVCFSGDGALLASSSIGGPVLLWDPATQRLLHELSGHQGAIRTLAVHPSNKLLAGGCDDHRVYLWDAGAGELRHVLVGHQDVVRHVAFSADGRYLVTGSHDQTVRAWEVDRHQLRLIVPEVNVGLGSAFALSPDGTTLSYGGIDGFVRLMDLQSGSVVLDLPMAGAQTLAIAWSVHGQAVACGSDAGAIWVWDTDRIRKGQTTEARFRVQVGGQPVWRLIFSPDGQYLACYAGDESIYVLDSLDGHVRYVVTGLSSAFNMAASSASDGLVTADSEHALLVLDFGSGELRWRLPGHQRLVTSIDADPAGSLVASSSNDGSLRLWNLSAGICQAVLEPPLPYAGMNIAGAAGISLAQRATLVTLGAIEV